MKLREITVREFVEQWLQKAEMDFEVASHLLREGARFREGIAFHCQQAVEKYLKALLVAHQIEFPKTHEIGKLLRLVRQVDPALANSLTEAEWLTPFGADVRYPSDTPELLPDVETAALQVAARVRQAVRDSLKTAGP